MSSSSATSSAGLLVSLVSVAIYGAAAYYMNFNPNNRKMQLLFPEPLRQYGQIKFLTYQCLMINLACAVLHVLAHFVRSLVGVRDFVFTCLAYPVGSIVVYTFWAVYHGMGRQYIFPVELSQYYPDWLNHATHTLIAPLNLLTLFLVRHTYRPGAAMVTLVYFILYVVLLHYIKFKSGYFVYGYLEAMNQVERVIYFAGTAALAYLMYKSGQLLSGLVHPTKGLPAKASKKPKQK